MKNLYTTLFLLALAIGGLQAQTTWDNFEDVRKGTYGFINGVFIPYTGNPDPTGVNTSAVVAEYSRNPAELFDVVILDAQMADLGDYLSGAKTMSMDVWSPAPGTTVQITMENSVLALPANFPTGRHSVYLATTSTSEEWETITFSFDSQPDAGVANDNVDRMVILFEPNTNNGSTWYWDNLMGPEFADDPCEGVGIDPNIGMDFECQQNINFTFSHSGPNFRRIINPDMSGANTSDYVGSYVRNGGEETDVIIARTQDGNITLPAGLSFNLDVWDSAAPTEVIISLQLNPDDGNEATTVKAVSAMTSDGNTWETLNFNFSGVGGQEYNQIVILFDQGNFTSDQYYFDNFVVGPMVNTFEVLPTVTEVVAYPNPTAGQMTFEYELSESAQVQVNLFDHTGRLVANVFTGDQPTGKQFVEFDAGNLANGVYFYTISIDGQTAGDKITILR
jgi:hypothetical protein